MTTLETIGTEAKKSVIERLTRRHANFRACALLIIAALTVLAIVGWLR